MEYCDECSSAVDTENGYDPVCGDVIGDPNGVHYHCPDIICKDCRAEDEGETDASV